MVRAQAYGGVMRMRSLALAALVSLAVAACTDGTGGPGAEPPLPAGSWGDPDASGRPSLVLADDGRLSGSDGCNRLMGSWTSEGSSATFSPLAVTRMYCEGIDTWLSAAASAEASASTLRILDSSGSEIGTLARVED